MVICILKQKTGAILQTCQEAEVFYFSSKDNVPLPTIRTEVSSELLPRATTESTGFKTHFSLALEASFESGLYHRNQEQQQQNMGKFPYPCRTTATVSYEELGQRDVESCSTQPRILRTPAPRKLSV